MAPPLEAMRHMLCTPFRWPAASGTRTAVGYADDGLARHNQQTVDAPTQNPSPPTPFSNSLYLTTT
jgi:hypothetical protein